MPAGLPAATITVRRFLAKVCGDCANPSRMAASIFASSAEANTSAGAPCSSGVRRVELPAKFSRTSVPEFSSSKLSLSSPKASVSEEAAKTVKADSPLPSEPPDPPHPKRTGRSAATTTQHESFAPTDPIYAPTGAGSPCQQRLKDASCYRCAGPESLCKCTKFLAEVLSVALASRRIFVPSSPEDAPPRRSGRRRAAYRAREWVTSLFTELPRRTLLGNSYTALPSFYFTAVTVRRAPLVWTVYRTSRSLV